MNYNEIFHISLLSEVTLKCYTGMEDKIISTKGLCMLVTDEGVEFFDNIQKKQKNHESDLSMLNQLFDGKGDRMTLSQNKERIVSLIPVVSALASRRNLSVRRLQI